MSLFLKARLSKLENRRRPQRINRNVVAIDAKTEFVIGPLPKTKAIMLVVDHGTNDEWETAALAQQSELISNAIDAVQTKEKSDGISCTE